MTDTSSLSNELRLFLQQLTTEPGVYQMKDGSGTVLYVGKAANLKKRVSSYFNKQQLHVKTKALVEQIVSIDICITRSETEALLLESSLIKSLLPKYNILMRDDKSYPFIYLSTHLFPSMNLIRAKKKPQKGAFFGPFPSVKAARDTFSMIQKIFKIRNCSDNTFNGRTRPCLQYQIKRCSAPCTQYITADDYQQSLSDATRFLQGKSQQILDELANRMDLAVAQLEFERAALLRDQIKSLRQIQEQQSVVSVRGDMDVVVGFVRPGFACIQCVTIREGEVLASQSFFPQVPKRHFDEKNDDQLWQDVFSAFVTFYYVETPERIPQLLLTDKAVINGNAIESMLSELRGKTCRIQVGGRGMKARWLDFSKNNLQHAIAKRHASIHMMALRYQALNDVLNLKTPISKMMCFDISHTQGDETVASCVVFDTTGPCKREYRLFNIQGITPGDDYAAMEQAIRRCFKRLIDINQLPDVLIIDGGKGQVNVATNVLNALHVERVFILGIAKGPDRKAGFERLIINGAEQILPPESLALHLLQHIRDEAHRFAITAHRKKRAKKSVSSSLEDIPGIGAKRRQALLRRFGGIRELARATDEELSKVSGISKELALRILQHLK